MFLYLLCIVNGQDAFHFEDFALSLRESCFKLKKLTIRM